MKTYLIILIVSLFLVSTSELSYAQGLTYDWAHSFSGVSANKKPQDIVVDGNGLNGAVYSVGAFSGTVDFDPNASIYNLTTPNAQTDIYISKLDANGTLDWAVSIGGNGADQANAIAVDGAHNIYVAGFFNGTVDFNPGPDTFMLTATNSYDEGFICKLKPNGDFVWAVSLGGFDHDAVLDIAVAQNGDIYATGFYEGPVDFDPSTNVFQMTSAGLSDIFVTKLDSSANFLWAKSMGGTWEDIGKSIAVDISGRAHITGYFSQTADFDPGASVFNLSSSGGTSAFVARLNPTGSLSWAKAFTGGFVNKQGNSITIDGFGSVYTTGTFGQTVDFDPGPGTFPITTNGGYDIFINKLDNMGNLVWAKSLGGSGNDGGNSISLGADNDVYTCGYFRNTVDFDPGIGVENRTSNGLTDMYLSKLDSSGNFAQAITTGGTGEDLAEEIQYASGVYVYMTGLFVDTVDFNPKPPIDNLISISPITQDIFLQKFQTCHISYTLANQTACGSYTSPITNQTWTTSGTYFDTVGVNTNYCDSITIINLTIHPITYDTLNPVVCGSYTSPSTNYTWTSSGTYTDTLVNMNNCDSMITINLTVNQPSFSSLNPVACNSYTSPISNTTWTVSGIYYDTLMSINNCDSIITYNLTINQSSTATINPFVCDSFISPSNNYIWTQNGTYNDTIPNATNCDSVITVNLTVVTIDTSVSKSGIQLTSNEIGTGVTYQWIDCNNAYIPIVGATNQSFTPTANGSYGVILNRQNCTDTSSCHTINAVNLDDFELSRHITLYPNPANEIVYISSNNISIKLIQLLNVEGKIIFEYEGDTERIDVSRLSTGLYFIKFIKDKGIRHDKFFKK